MYIWKVVDRPYFHSLLVRVAVIIRTVTTILLFLVAMPLAAQDVETLLSGEVEHGGFGGPVLKGSNVNGSPALFVGGRGGWIINHTLILGGGGYGLVNNIDALVPGAFGARRLQFGYGGFEIEYIRQWDHLLHWSAMVLIGGGAVGYRMLDEETLGFEPPNRMDEIFVVEPAIQVNLNMTEFLRISAGVSYRYVSGVTTPATSNEKLSGGGGVLTFRFGKF